MGKKQQINGLLAENAFIKRSLLKGWNVAMPLSPSLEYDFITEKDGKLVKVQVKCVYRDGAYKKVSMRRVGNTRYKEGHFDFLYCVDLEAGIEWFIDWEKVKNVKSSISIYSSVYDDYRMRD